MPLHRHHETLTPNLQTSLRLCETCDTMRPYEELNIEAAVHHGAHRIECLDRKACERRKRHRRTGG